MLIIKQLNVVKRALYNNVGSLFLLLIYLLIAKESRCQNISRNNELIRQMLCRISAIQLNHEKDFPEGMIPSYRASHRRKEVMKNDDNIFFTGLVVFTLRYLYPYFDLSSKKICDSIFARAAPLYKRHQNQKGRSTFNYWQTDSPEIFPNGGLLNIFNKSQALPDDMDVTSVILLANLAPASTVEQVHQLMQDYRNMRVKKAKSSLPAYRDIPAYSTWFGNKMPIDLDFCVLANVLLLVGKYNLPYTAADSASLELIVKAVENRDYLKRAAIISPSYNRTPVLIYHLARLMSLKEIPVLERLKPQLISDATASYMRADNFFDRIILSTSLIRWGVKLPDAVVKSGKGFKEFVEEDDFVFFIANIASMLPAPLNNLFGKTGIGKYYYYSPAYNYSLLIENMILHQTEK